MGYDFHAKKEGVDGFHMGAFSFPILLEAAGYLWPCVQGAGRYCYVTGADPRMPDIGPCPLPSTNDGFPVTEEEARILARIARNYVAVNRSLEEQPEVPLSAPCYQQPWPRKIRSDFLDLFERFADWCETSGGFEIH